MMLTFIIAFILGAFMTIFTLALANAAKNEDS
jgi:hypothetical protein